jgi:hypothetical protein
MLIRNRTLLSFILPLLACLMAWPQHVQAQRYPFFVQPISVEQLRPISEELQLSPNQMEAVLEFHEGYEASFNGLQEGELKKLVDRGVAISSNMNFMGMRRGASFDIPPRKEIESLVRAALDVWDAFERIDERFFGQVQGVLSDDQFAALERVRFRRRADAYRTIHLRAVENFNRGVDVDFESMIKRLDLSELEMEAVHVPMQGYERELVRHCKRLQSDMMKIVDFLLDEVDRMGLRDMEMMEMMTVFADPAKQDEMKVLINVQSIPIQETAAKISKLNWETYNKIFPVLPPDKALDFQERYYRSVYSRAGQDVFDARDFIGRAMDLPSISSAQTEQLTAIRDQLNSGFSSIAPRIARAYEEKRAYRSIEQFEGDVVIEAQEDIDRHREKAEKIGEEAQERAENVLDELQLEELNVNEEKSQRERPRWSRGRSGGSRGGGGGGSSWRSRGNDFPLPPLTMDQATQFALWVGASESDMPILQALHLDYMGEYDGMAKEFDGQLETKYEAMEEEGGRRWMKRREIRNSLTDEYRVRLATREDRFFDEFSVSLPPSVNGELIKSIRRAHDRSRKRLAQRQGDWVLRQRPESFIDVPALILASDPAELTPPQRTKIIAVLAEYEEQVAPDVELLGSQMEKLQGIQERLWSGDEEYDADMRSKIEELRKKRRDEMSKTAQRLTTVNRDTIEMLLSELPESSAWPFREEYDKSAYPDVFSDRDNLDEIIDKVIVLGSITPTERQSLETLILDHRGRYREITDEMLVMAKEASMQEVTWPPNGNSMNSYMKREQLQYRRGELNKRTLTRIQLLLGDERALEVPGLSAAEAMLEETEVSPGG